MSFKRSGTLRLMVVPDPDGTLGQRIAFYREIRDLSQKELATRLGTHSMTISKWERDIMEPSSSSLHGLAQHLRVSMQMLVGQPAPGTEETLDAVGKAVFELEGKELQEDERLFLRVVIESFSRSPPKPGVLMDFLSGYRKSPELRSLFFLDPRKIAMVKAARQQGA